MVLLDMVLEERFDFVVEHWIVPCNVHCRIHCVVCTLSNP